VNAAGYIPAGLPNAGIAQGSLFTIFGTGIAPVPFAQPASYPLPKTLEGVSVKVTVNGVSKDAYISFVGNGNQINAILPSDTPVGTGTVTVTYNGQTSAAAPITVVKSQVGLVAWSSSGAGSAAATNANNEFVNLTNSVKPGDVIVLWGTGLGPVDPVTEGTQPPKASQVEPLPKVLIGGKQAKVQYAGRSGFTAEDQINVEVPAGLGGCYVPVMVQVNDTVSNTVTIPVSANGGACSDPLSFTAEQLVAAQKAGSFRAGSIGLTRILEKATVLGIPIDGTIDGGTAKFGKYAASYANLFASTGVNAAQVSVSPGSCTVFTFIGGATTFPSDPAGFEPLDAGTITITGPKGKAQMAQTSRGIYNADLGGGLSLPPLLIPKPTFLDPGQYTIDNGTGGSGDNAVGPFSVSFTMPQFISWTNMDAINTIPRSQGLDLTWTGGGSDDLVLITGTSVTSTGGDAPGAGFVCLETTAAKHFVVPPEVLSALPPSAPASLIDFGGILLVSSGKVEKTFTAPGLDQGTVLVDGGSAKPVSYR
jgi:uncharacterized protein (TIGR03437 family)